jgi:ferrous iron transport protein A
VVGLIPLDSLASGQCAEIAEITGEPGWLGRMAEVGIRVGSRVQIVQSGNPCILLVGEGRLSLRGGGHTQILVRPA